MCSLLSPRMGSSIVHVNDHSGQFNPHRRGLIKNCYFLPHQPGVVYGAPSSFVNLSVISPPVPSRVLREKLEEEAYNQLMVTSGLIHSFAVSHAAAHYRGICLITAGYLTAA